MAYGWISITGVRFSTNLGGRIDLYPCHFSAWVFLVFWAGRVQGCRTAMTSRYFLSGFPRLSVLRVAEARLGVLFLREYQKVFARSRGAGFTMGGRRFSTKTLHMSQEGAKFMTLRYPMGNGKRGQRQRRFGENKRTSTSFLFLNY